MKRLSDLERGNLSLEKAQDILSDFGKHIEISPCMYTFESELPWEKGDILFAAWKVLPRLKNEESRSAMFGALLWLLDVLPDPSEYRNRIIACRKERIAIELLGRGFTEEEIVELSKDVDFSDDRCLDWAKNLHRRNR